MHRIAHRLIVAVACSLLGIGPGAATDEPAPDFVLTSLDGDNLRLSEYRGEIVLLNFWASWCGRCRDQLPVLETLRARYADRPLQVLSVNLDRRPEKARATAAAAGLSVPVLMDSERQVVRSYDPKRLPQTLLLDPSGRVRSVFEGYRDGDADRYAAAIDQLFAEEAWLTAGAGKQ